MNLSLDETAMTKIWSFMSENISKNKKMTKIYGEASDYTYTNRARDKSSQRHASYAALARGGQGTVRQDTT